MNLVKFQTECLRTFKPDEEKLSILHALAGMFSEVEELQEAIEVEDTVNIGEELADLLFYLVCYCHFRKIDVSQFEDMITASEAIPIEFRYDPVSIYRWLSTLADRAKKVVFYDKEVDDTTVIENILQQIIVLANLKGHKISLMHYMQKVINKLKIRYADKFTAAEANTRNLSAERTVLEGE